MFVVFFPFFPLLALYLASKRGFLKVLSRFLIGFSMLLIIFSTWFLIDLYDETQDFIELRKRYEQSQQ
jgi:4-amino-4-deoxy-L-arabinose transferase-like glycosyltransferase